MYDAKKCLFIFGSNKNMHYFCRDKMSIHPLKLMERVLIMLEL